MTIFVENAEPLQYLVDAPDLHRPEMRPHPVREAVQLLGCKAVMPLSDEVPGVHEVLEEVLVEEILVIVIVVAR